MDLSSKSLKLNWHDGIVLAFCDSSILGIAGEAAARGFNLAAVMHDFVFSNPQTDVVDVGSDLYNSELAGCILGTADVTDTGIVTEEALRWVYDAYAHSCGRMYTERWSDPGVQMDAILLPWHIVSNRHGLLRRALLGFRTACGRSEGSGPRRGVRRGFPYHRAQ